MALQAAASKLIKEHVYDCPCVALRHLPQCQRTEELATCYNSVRIAVPWTRWGWLEVDSRLALPNCLPACTPSSPVDGHDRARLTDRHNGSDWPGPVPRRRHCRLNGQQQDPHDSGLGGFLLIEQPPQTSTLWRMQWRRWVTHDARLMRGGNRGSLLLLYDHLMC